MVVILCISMAVTHILKFGSHWKEGFESENSMENEIDEILKINSIA
jgi:hypothetical protein